MPVRFTEKTTKKFRPTKKLWLYSLHVPTARSACIPALSPVTNLMLGRLVPLREEEPTRRQRYEMKATTSLRSIGLRNGSKQNAVDSEKALPDSCGPRGESSWNHCGEMFPEEKH